MAYDETESLRREMLEIGQPQYELAHAEQRWDTDQLRAEFEVIGFLAPLVAVIRKSDGVKGTLMFTHSPRWYFNSSLIGREMSQLRIDLRKRISDRLDQWAMDSDSLYDMAGIESMDAADDIFAAVYFLLLRGVVNMDISAEEFAGCVKESIEAIQQQRRQR